MNPSLILICLCAALIGQQSLAAQSLLNELSSQEDSLSPQLPVLATFKGTRIIHGHSVEMPAPNELQFIIQHRFGRINTGFYEMFGWDQASIRIGLEYTLPFSQRFALGIGRSSYGKTWDGYLKTKILRQTQGASPISIVMLNALAINGLNPPSSIPSLPFHTRMSYVHQLLIARKFSPRISFQISPSIIHKNLVPEPQQANTFFASGFAGHVRISKRVALTAEYFWLFPAQNIPTINQQAAQNALSLGVDIETGGHVFQFHLSNASAMFETGFISETTGKPWQGDIHFGFNISRSFSFRK
jgi:hypothetical protein